MAVVTCTNCRNKYSDFNSECPKCAHPNMKQRAREARQRELDQGTIIPVGSVAKPTPPPKEATPQTSHQAKPAAVANSDVVKELKNIQSLLIALQEDGYNTKISDLDMPFGALITLIVKIAIAAIPAALIVTLIVTGAIAILSVFFRF